MFKPVKHQVVLYDIVCIHKNVTQQQTKQCTNSTFFVVFPELM